MSLKVGDLEELLRARILIVEDEGIVAKDLRDSLRALGYEVCATCATGEDAIARARALQPDLVLMDIRLRGEMDGIEAARAIREHVDVPVVFLTAYADADTLRRAASVGPYGYVVKPFEDRELQSVLVMAMCKHRAFAELDQRVQERTRQLATTEARYRRLQAVAELGLFALGTPDTKSVRQRAVGLLAEATSADFACLLERRADGSLLLRATVGCDERLEGEVVAAGVDARAPFFSPEDSPSVASFTAQSQRRTPSFLEQQGVVAGMSAAIHGGCDGGTSGVLCACSRAQRSYSESDLGFLQAIANVIATSVLRSNTERALREAERAAEQERVRALIAEEGLRARDEFLSVASHELRTPVAALQLQLEALTELLKQMQGADARLPETAERARRSIARLAELVESVLDVSRISAGRFELEIRTLDLTATVREVVSRHQDLARNAGCTLRLSAAESIVGSWDPLRIEQVVTNLLSNALKFGAGHPIEVSVEKKQGAALVRVRDHGAGMDEADVQRVLRKFERAVSHQKYGGLGLGLYLASQIVEAHGGMMEVASERGKGATFTVVLPV